jgi:hypothetical protein
MSTKKKPTGGYPIGYAKPPRKTQFRKGQSGHPAGRPKGTPNFVTALERALSEAVVVNEGGQRHTISKLEATVKQLVNKATLGDPRATQQLLGVLKVIDSEPSESSPANLNITKTDEQVMQNIIERIRATNNEGGNDDDPHL